MATTIRDAHKDDLDWVLAINNEAVPDVTALNREGLERLVDLACYFRISEIDRVRAGFLIAMRSTADYESPNFRWFKRNYSDFVYIDRVVVEGPFRRHGIGKVFYADIQSFAEKIAPYLTCEVNLAPPNESSLLFHGAYGFQEVGQQLTEGESKRVSLLAKELPSYDFVQRHYGRVS